MIDKSLIVTYKPTSSASSGADWIRLRQHEEDGYGSETFREWMEGKGHSMGAEGLWLGMDQGTVFNYYEEYLSTCSDFPEVGIEVHKSRVDLEYSLSTTHGYLSQATVETTKDIQSHTIRAENSLTLDNEPTTGAMAKWEGTVFNLSGESITPPKITQKGKDLTWTPKVIGVLRVEYGYSYDLHFLTIEPRGASPESSTKDIDGQKEEDPGKVDYVNPQTMTQDQITTDHIVEFGPTEVFADGNAGTSFQATVIAIWSGSPEVLDVSIETDEVCIGLAYSVKIDTDDPDEPVTEECYELHKKYDPCTGELLDTWTVRVACTDAIDEALEEFFGDT